MCNLIVNVMVTCTYINEEEIKMNITLFIRPMLEYVAAVWNPNLKKHVSKGATLEGYQLYEESLEKLPLLCTIQEGIKRVSCPCIVHVLIQSSSRIHNQILSKKKLKYNENIFEGIIQEKKN